MKIAIIGMGPAGLMAGSQLVKAGHEVHFYDHKKAAGRKFLVAGNGGFNLTHSEELESFISKYEGEIIQKAVETFTNDDWIRFLEQEIKIPTYIGSSGKIFPEKGIKPITVLYNWMNYLTHYKASFHYEHQFVDFNENQLILSHEGKITTEHFDQIILALGGGSWKMTGSTAEWIPILAAKGILCNPLQSSNSGFEIGHWDKFKVIEGQTIKNIVVSYLDDKKEGDIVVSSYGLEGTPIYYMNRAFRKDNSRKLMIDFKPTKTLDEIQTILKSAVNNTEGLKQLKLSKTTIQFLKLSLSKEMFTSIESLSSSIKAFEIQPKSLRPIDEVISTVGGIDLKEVSTDFELNSYKNVYVCGEMLDWDAPTGGYLIQACVSSGYAVAQSILSKSK
jgi:uncharacterized flavoprotein (TIGR03862 family)